MITEIASLGGSAGLGFLFQFIANMQLDGHKQKMALMGAAEESKEKASNRSGIWVRRFIVLVLMGILAVIATGAGNMPTNIVTIEPGVSILWGLFETGREALVTPIVGGLYDETIRISILSIIGYYFGTSAASR